MPKLIITIDDTVDDLNAAYYVMKVIQQGRLSETKNGRCYCFITTFTNGVRVCCNRTKAGADTFWVSKTPDANAVKP